MDTSFLVSLLFLQCFQESVVCHGVHMCKAVKVSLEKSSENKDGDQTLIKFDFIPLRSSSNIAQTSTLAAGQITANNNESSATTVNISKVSDASSSSVDPTKTPSPSAKESSAVPTNTSFAREECQNVTTVNTTCHCEIYSKTNFTINIFDVLQANNSQSMSVLYWTIDENSTCQYLTSKTPKEILNREIGISVEESDSMFSYSIIVEVKGDSINAACTGDEDDKPVVTDTGRLSAPYELFLNNVLLIVGAILAVIGILLMSTGIVVWRRYRKKHKKQKKKLDKLEMEEIQCNYEEISTDNFEHTHVSFQDEIDLDSHDQGTESSASRKMSKEKRSSFFRSASLEGGVISDKNHLKKTPSPKKGRLKKLKLTGKKKKHRKGSAETEQKPSCTDSDSDVAYSNVQMEYEDTQEQHPSPKTHDIKVPTPLLLLHNNAEVRPLRKTDHLKELQEKVKTMPKMEISDKIVTLQNHNTRNENTYSHLNRAGGRSKSCHMDLEDLYDDSKLTSSSNSNNVRSKTSDVVTGRKNVFKFHILKPVSPKSANMSEGPKGDEMGTNVDVNQEEQEHIYEPMEKDETAETEASQPQERESCAQANIDDDATDSGDDLPNKENNIEMTRDTVNEPSSKIEDGLYESVSGSNEDAPECDISDDGDDDDVIVKHVNYNSINADPVNTKGKQIVMGEADATKSNDSPSTTPMTMSIHSGSLVLARPDLNRDVEKIANRSSRDILKTTKSNGRDDYEAASRNSRDIDKTASENDRDVAETESKNSDKNSQDIGSRNFDRSSRDFDRNSRDIDRSSRDFDRSNRDIIEITKKNRRDIDKSTGYNNVVLKSANPDNDDESNNDPPVMTPMPNKADKLHDRSGPITGHLSDSHASINTNGSEEKEGGDQKNEEKDEEKEENNAADYDYDKFTIIENILYEPLPLRSLSDTSDG